MANSHGDEPTLADSGPSEYAGSRFSEVRAQILSDPYKVLPYHPVTIGSMFKKRTNILKQDSITLVDRDADLVSPMQKIFHAVGICFFGRWTITEETDYTGCFRSGADYLLLVRCSTLFGETESGKRRGFGLAGKIFPTLDPDELVKTANFVCIDSLGGTLAKRFTDVALSNQPALGLNWGLLRSVLVVANAIRVFNAVGAPDVTHRPLYELSEQGLAAGETAKGPQWIQLTAEEGIGKSDAIDFREELRVANYKDRKLRFSVAATDEKPSAPDRHWRRIGAIELTEDVCSDSGDHRIRFRHVPNRR